jgi:predicted ATPase
VITGAPCSGKSTTINQLRDMGYRTVPEAGRRYVENELGKGRSLGEIRRDQGEFTRRIYALMLAQERALQPDQVVFLDRAIPDAPAFYRFAGINPNTVLSDCFQYHYRSVFILDRLPYELDGVRAEDDEAANFIDHWMQRDYTALGYNVKRVPLMQPEHRLNYILERIRE